MIISINGKKNSGKDTVGNIIQYLTSYGKYNSFESFMKRSPFNGGTPYKNKKFADKLKDMVCMMIGCTRKQLEDREFKEKELGPEWWRYKIHDGSVYRYVSKSHYVTSPSKDKFIVKHTPRTLLQLLGTECGRNIIHPNLWVNSLMSDYKTLGFEDKNPSVLEFPKWIITDMRFPNELEAVKKRKGITIRVNRWVKNELTEKEAADLYVTGDTQVFGVDDNGVESRIRIAEDFNNFSRFVTELPESNHESETALDNFKLDYTLDNNGTLEELIEKIRQILIKEQIL